MTTMESVKPATEITSSTAAKPTKSMKSSLEDVTLDDAIKAAEITNAAVSLLVADTGPPGGSAGEPDDGEQVVTVGALQLGNGPQ
ncbi:MAG: hypothetical protein ACLQUY_27810 [Ktedonobacterales bacterium]